MTDLLNITFNQDSLELLVREEVQRLLPHILMPQKENDIEPLTIDIKKMAEITGLSQSSLRANILIDPRINSTELYIMPCKRLWDYKAFKKAYLEIAKTSEFTKI